MSFVAVAIGGSALVGGATSIISGKKAAKAAKKAATLSNDTERYIFDQQRADFAPYRDVGQGALYKLADMYGVPRANGSASVQSPGSALYKQFGIDGGGGDYATPDFTGQLTGNPGTAGMAPGMTAGFDGFKASPGYQFRLSEGLKAIERSAAASGNLRSGATMKSIGRYADGTASGEYENFANRLAALAGVGQSATASTAAAGQNFANATSANLNAAGAARASAYANTGNAINQGVTNLASAYLYNKGYGKTGVPTGGNGGTAGRGGY